MGAFAEDVQESATERKDGEVRDRLYRVQRWNAAEGGSQGIFEQTAGACNLSPDDQALDPLFDEDRSENLTQHRAGLSEDTERVGIVLLSQRGNIHHVQGFILSGRMPITRQNSSPRHIILGNSVPVGPVEKTDGGATLVICLNLSVNAQGEAQPGAEGYRGNARIAACFQFAHHAQHASGGVLQEPDGDVAQRVGEPGAEADTFDGPVLVVHEAAALFVVEGAGRADAHADDGPQPTRPRRHPTCHGAETLLDGSGGSVGIDPRLIDAAGQDITQRRKESGLDERAADIDSQNALALVSHSRIRP